MKRNILIVLCLLLTIPCLARHRTLGKTELIEKAPIIALVEVTGVEEAEQAGSHWVYRQKADVKLVRLFKGELSKTATIFAEKNYVCSRASFRPGTYLVFLQQDKGLTTCFNHSNGAKQVTDGRLPWFVDNTPRKAQSSLDGAVSDILAVLGT